LKANSLKPSAGYLKPPLTAYVVNQVRLSGQIMPVLR
jgi:hypothetical protein